MPKQAEMVEPARRVEEAVWPGLTLEVVLYTALIAAAALIRLFDLGRWPLLTGEATQALAAWRFLQAQPMGQAPVPLLFDGALAGFFAFGANDVVARLLPAFLGLALVFLPALFLRRRLGTWGTLAATFILALSPTMVFYSRTLSGAMPALAGLGAVLAAVELSGRGQARTGTIVGMVGLAVALTASPWTYTFLLAALLFVGLGALARRRGRPWPGWDPFVGALRAQLSDGRAWALLALLVALLSTALALNLSGLQGTANLLGAWLSRLVPGSGGQSFDFGLSTLVFYELGPLILGIWGLVLGLRRGDLWAVFLGGWAILGILLATLSGARDGEALVFTVLPLALLSGLAVQAIVVSLPPAHWAWTGGITAALSVIAGFWWLQAATYATGSVGVVQVANLSLIGALAVVAPVFLLAGILVFWYWIGRNETTWALALVGFGLLACLLFRNSVAASFETRDPREPLLTSPSALDLRDMRSFLIDWSSRTVGDQHELAIVVQDDLGPLVPWYLRDFKIVRLASAPTGEEEAGAWVVRSQPGTKPPAGLVGEHFRLTSTVQPASPLSAQMLAWWMLREGSGPQQADTCELWVKP